jgi:hypothetical protein
MVDRTTQKALLAELSKWDGVAGHRFEIGGKHQRLVVETDRGSRFVTLSLTASDFRATKNKVSDLRKVLRALGAEKV